MLELLRARRIRHCDAGASCQNAPEVFGFQERAEDCLDRVSTLLRMWGPQGIHMRTNSLSVLEFGRVATISSSTSWQTSKARMISAGLRRAVMFDRLLSELV